MNDLSGLRWLAREALPEAVALLADVPPPLLLRSHRSTAIREYVSWWIRNPDPAGSFAAKTRWLRKLPSPLLTHLLLMLGYDGLLYVDEGTVMGHVFFQRRGTALHGFSTAVAESAGGHGYSAVMLLDFIAYASALPGIDRARVGTGRTSASRRLLERLGRNQARLGWRVTADGWVTFR